jgi:hypothetical protein
MIYSVHVFAEGSTHKINMFILWFHRMVKTMIYLRGSVLECSDFSKLIGVTFFLANLRPISKKMCMISFSNIQEMTQGQSEGGGKNDK